MCYDTDDILYPENIFEQVHYLESHPECSMVRTNGYIVNDLTKQGRELFIYRQAEMDKTDIFYDLVRGKTNNWPGSYMIRRDVFLKRTGGNYYTSRFGQNLQFMLPMSFNSKVGFINKPLMSYYEHSGSHSHSGGLEWTIQRVIGYSNNRIEILKRIPMEFNDRQRLINLVISDREREIQRLKTKERKKEQKNALVPIIKRVGNKLYRLLQMRRNERLYRKENSQVYWGFIE